ncbi:recombinase [Candidatus Omnitrophus magneticus]|uniref:Recombinase n=1 Tax=Candidatus Omnitrophus magneticus TaxID=1609969 RepID=A0A0F0CTT7_9BACT|nr:recombinase [Candidatus Omnitrophus magneticus]
MEFSCALTMDFSLTLRLNDGKKPSEIANIMNAEGIRTKSRIVTTNKNEKKKVGGNRFNEDFVKKIITNPLYKGYVHFNNEEFKGIHPSIVSVQTWDKTYELLQPKHTKRLTYSKDAHVHLLKGIAKCGECGVLLTPYPGGKKDRHGNPYLYYACGKVVDSGKESSCKVRALPAREFENAIKKCLSDLGHNKAIVESAIKSTAKFTKSRIKPLEAELEKTEKRLSTFLCLKQLAKY